MIVALGRYWRISWHIFFDLQKIRCDGRDANDIVLMGADFFDEAVERGEVQERARGLDVGLDEHQTPTSVKHAQGKRSLGASDLVLVQFHGIHDATTVLVVLGIGTKDAGQEDFGPRSSRMSGAKLRSGVVVFHGVRFPSK